MEFNMDSCSCCCCCGWETRSAQLHYLQFSEMLFWTRWKINATATTDLYNDTTPAGSGLISLAASVYKASTYESAPACKHKSLKQQASLEAVMQWKTKGSVRDHHKANHNQCKQNIYVFQESIFNVSLSFLVILYSSSSSYMASCELKGLVHIFSTII